MAQTFFFWTPADREPGHVFPAGNHGKVIRDYRHFTADATNGWKLAIEMVLENVRLSQPKELPSRLSSAFAFLSEADAKSRAFSNPASRLYEVELVDEAAPRHIADFDLYSTICKSEPSQAFLPKTELLAKDYWQGSGNGVKELLTLSDLRVVRRLYP
ncbi:hypothetical protein [Cupriavidus necator]|uniref:hypothetical protein n=1 Tax=Cupriavidus necator TaxID=106590 RepID=UPI0005A20A4F|nr:hypothetical protein [Cupriavidus necator]